MVSVIVHSSIMPLYVLGIHFFNQHGLIELFCAGNAGTNIIIEKMAVFVLWLCFWTIAASLNNGLSSPFLSLGVGPLIESRGQFKNEETHSLRTFNPLMMCALSTGGKAGT